MVSVALHETLPERPVLSIPSYVKAAKEPVVVARAVLSSPHVTA